MSAQIKHIQDFLNTALKNTGFYYINNNQCHFSDHTDHCWDQNILDHGIDNDDQDITWESLKIINELKPSIFSELAGFKNKNHIIHLVNTD